MNSTKVLQGASRLRLTTKRGNKDFYKGTGQAYVPGGGHRTGPPGKHVVNGKAKFRVMDEKVRYYVGPGEDALLTTNLRPYAQAADSRSPRPRYNLANPYVPFSPLPLHTTQHLVHPTTGEPMRIPAHDGRAFGRWYQQLSIEERAKVVGEQRRKWYEAMVARGRREHGEEEADVQALEESQAATQAEAERP